ncbi:helix-turn-helix transcriptional regulator [Kitasatospora sp. NPDC089797]|uniref:helix-turn-helix domain-containing protein n=1 Tax=Kitasatospora sp. NPDC089797 TaxID=3155298 RepID=UPI003447BF7D
MASNAVISGPTAGRVAENVERIRKARQLHQKDLSARLREVGRPMLPTVVSKIERGERRVDVDDLVALALALNVSPTTLLLPPTSSDTPVALTECVSVASRTAWQWAEGQRTAMELERADGVDLAGPGADPAISQDAYEREQEFARQQAAYRALAQPEERRRAEDHSAIRMIRNLEDVVTDLVAPAPDMDRAGLAALGRMAHRRHTQLGIELDGIVENLPPVHPGAPVRDMTSGS